MSMFTVTRLMTLSRKWTEGTLTVNKEPATSPLPAPAVSGVEDKSNTKPMWTPVQTSELERKSWTGDENTPVVSEPQLLKTELASKPSSQRQESDPATLYEANLSTQKETEEAARKETARVKGRIAVERHSHNERVKELTQEKDELLRTLETSKKETARVKAMIAVERHSHNERVEKLTREKNEGLEAAEKESKRLQGVMQVERDSLNERVKELTREMDELVKALQAATKETQRVKSVIAVERHSHSERMKESAQEKNNLVETLEVTKKEAQRLERENRALVDQVRLLQQNQYPNSVFGALSRWF